MKAQLSHSPESVAVETNSRLQPPSPSTTAPTENVSSGSYAPLLSPPPCTPSRAGKRKADTQDGSDEKRRKSSPGGLMQHPRFWLPDGNVRVQIGSIRFNLHRSRLGASSLWFKTYFAERDTKECGDGDVIVDEPDVELDETDEPEVVELNKTDELGVIELDDTGIDIADFEQLLIAMDDAIGYHYSPPRFATLASILRASSILVFPKFQYYACDAIQALFPDSLKTVRANIIPHAAEAIILARAFELPCVLKRAFYELARSPPTAATAGALSSLAPDDIVLVAQAQKRMAAEWRSIYTPPQCDVCAGSSATQHSDMSWFMSLPVGWQFDPILGLATLPQEYAKQKHYCGICAKVREKGWRVHALKIWKTDLDVWFGLGEDSDTDE